MEKRTKFGVGEILFGLVVLLGIVGTVSFFYFDEYLGEYQTTFAIVSSLAFIIGFIVLSVYARRKKSTYLRRVKVERALADWFEFQAAAGRPGASSRVLPAGTLESIARHLYTVSGYQFASGSHGKIEGLIRLINPEGQVELVFCRQELQPFGLREAVTFYELLRREKAAHGEVWALGGFTDDAARWVNKKPITLIDRKSIQEIAESLLAS